MGTGAKIGISIIAVAIFSITVISISAEESLVPSWIKNTVGFWTSGDVSDREFINAVEWMIENDVIGVSSSNDEWKAEADKLYRENQQLKDENEQLKAKIEYLEQNLVEEEYYEEELENLSIEELEEQAVSWNYKDILRNEEYYIGKIILLEGSIDVVKENDTWGDFVLLEVQTEEYGAWDTVFYVWYDGSRLLRDDTIQAYVVVDGVFERETLRTGSYIYNPIGTSIHLTCTNC